MCVFCGWGDGFCHGLTGGFPMVLPWFDAGFTCFFASWLDHSSYKGFAGGARGFQRRTPGFFGAFRKGTLSMELSLA